MSSDEFLRTTQSDDNVVVRLGKSEDPPPGEDDHDCWSSEVCLVRMEDEVEPSSVAPLELALDPRESEIIARMASTALGPFDFTLGVDEPPVTTGEIGIGGLPCGSNGGNAERGAVPSLLLLINTFAGDVRPGTTSGECAFFSLPLVHAYQIPSCSWEDVCLPQTRYDEDRISRTRRNILYELYDLV